jgi:hypothetical protein
MALNLTMGTIVTNAQVLCDRVSDSSISTTQWKAFAAMVYRELCQEINDTGCRYFETESTLTATGAANYAQPSGMLHLIGIDLIVDGAGTRRKLSPLLVQERSRLAGQTGEATHYQLIGTNIVLYPNPGSGSYRVLYVAQPTDQSATADGTSVDLICPAGERFLIWGMVSLAQHKSELNQQRAIGEWERARQDVRHWAANQDLITPPQRRYVEDAEPLPYGTDPDFWSNRQ